MKKAKWEIEKTTWTNEVTECELLEDGELVADIYDKKSFDRYVKQQQKKLLDKLEKEVEEHHKKYLKTHKELMYVPYSQAITDILTIIKKL